jgi:hypothetical protein
MKVIEMKHTDVKMIVEELVVTKIVIGNRMVTEEIIEEVEKVLLMETEEMIDNLISIEEEIEMIEEMATAETEEMAIVETEEMIDSRTGIEVVIEEDMGVMQVIEVVMVAKEIGLHLETETVMVVIEVVAIEVVVEEEVVAEVAIMALEEEMDIQMVKKL